MLEQLRQDLAFAIRTLCRSSGFAALVITGLAIGIGANATVFSLIDAVSIRQLPVPHPSELVALGLTENVEGSGAGTPGAAMYSRPLYEDVRDHNAVLSGLAATGFAGHVSVRPDTGTTAATEEAEHPNARFVSGNFFSVLGVPAARGRTLGPSDDAPAATPAVTLSYDYWTRRFANDPSVVGRTILVNDARVVITGITSSKFGGEVVGSSTDMWLPIGAHDVIEPHNRVLNDRTAMWLLLIGRMKQAVSIEQARAELVPIVRRSILAAATGRQLSRLAMHPIDVPISSASRGLSKVRATFAGALDALMAGVAILLCIVCVNVANLLLARGVARRREMALRTAVGAERAHIIWQLLTESGVIALVAGAAAVLVAWWGSHGLVLLATANEPLSLSVDPNLNTLLFTLGAAVASVLLFGVWPALRASRVDLASGLRAGGRSVATGARFGRGLIASQVALSLVLLGSAFTLARGVERSLITPLGLDRDHIIVAKLDIETPGLAGTRLANVVHAVRDRVSELPGVSAVTFSENGMFDDSRWSSDVDVPGTAPRASDDSLASTDGVGAGYARAIGATIVAGRDLTAADERPLTDAVLVNQAFANSYFPRESAVGRTLRFGHAEFQIVGVLADIRVQSLDPPRGHYARQVFYPYLHGDDTTRLGQPSELRLIVRTSGDPAALVRQVRRAIAAAAPLLSIERASPLVELVRGSIRAEHLVSEIASALGAFALLLAALGLFGVMSYSVAQRTNEIGIRIALGASRLTVRRMIVSQALAPVVFGVALGTPIVIVALRLLAHEVAATPTVDPLSVSIATVALLLTGAAAAGVPAYRASRIDPIETLKRD